MPTSIRFGACCLSVRYLLLVCPQPCDVACTRVRPAVCCSDFIRKRVSESGRVDLQQAPESSSASGAAGQTQD
jgi:hypothetical protein